MQFEIDKDRFLSAVKLATSVANSRGTMPILANVLLDAKAGKLDLSSTDMTISLTEAVACKVGAAGSVTVGVKHLANVLGTLPAGVVTVTALDSHWIQIAAKRSEFKIMGLPAGDFPVLPDSSAITFGDIDGSKLSEAIGRVLFSVCVDESRVNLNGALVSSSGSEMTMVSTDGHRLTKYKAKIDGPAFGDCVVPREGLAEVRKVLARGGNFGVAVTDDYLFVQSETVTLAVKLTRSTFPPWQQVMPKDHQRRVEASREELISALAQAVVVAPEATCTVKIRIAPGVMEIHADNPELGGVNLDLPVDFNGVEMTAGYNGAYMREALGVMTAERVALEFQGELDPVTIRPVAKDGDDGDDAPDFAAVVMPMRI